MSHIKDSQPKLSLVNFIYNFVWYMNHLPDTTKVGKLEHDKE